jgi:hypothetical protein
MSMSETSAVNQPKQQPIFNAVLIRNNAQKKNLTVHDKEIEKVYILVYLKLNIFR